MKLNAKEKCKDLYGKNPWVSFFTLVRFWTSSFVELEKFVPKEGKILDLGCGYGIFGNYLALCSSKREILGVDTDRFKINNAYKNLKNTSFQIGDATKMKLKNLDTITILDVLHHLDSYKLQEILIRDCKTMLSKKGLLIISDVDSKPFWKLILGRITDFVMYSGQPVYYRYQKEMIKLLKKYFSQVESFRLHNNPYPHIAYICKKK